MGENFKEIADLAKKNNLILEGFNHGFEGKQFNLVVLVQAYNEEEFTARFLEEAGKIADGIVFLDDGSTDRTHELARHPNLILKLRRERNAGFDDLGNRNLLLSFAALVPSRWFLFLDVDEIIDERYREELRETIERSDVDVVELRLVNLWGSERYFRADSPKPAEEGVLYLPRLLRKKENMKIISPKQLHFKIIPYQTDRIERSPIIIRHYGNINRERRVRRYERYMKEDKDNLYQPSYEHLLAGNVVLKPIEGLYHSEKNQPSL